MLTKDDRSVVHKKPLNQMMISILRGRDSLLAAIDKDAAVPGPQVAFQESVFFHTTDLVFPKQRCSENFQ